MKSIMIATGLLLAGSVLAADLPRNIVDEGQLGKTHALAAGTQLAAPGYPGAYADSGDDVCIALGYTVKADGTTGDFRFLQAWSTIGASAEKNDRYARHLRFGRRGRGVAVAVERRMGAAGFRCSRVRSPR